MMKNLEQSDLSSMSLQELHDIETEVKHKIEQFDAMQMAMKIAINSLN